MAYGRVEPPFVLSLLPASECGAYRSWFNPFKQREINVSVDTFCKIERFRHRRHICSYIKKKKKRKKTRRHFSTSLFFPLSFLFPFSFLFFSLIHSLTRRMLTEREKDRRYRTRYRTPLIPWQWFEAWRKVFEGSREPVFVPAPGWSIVHVFARSFPLGAILMQNAPILVDGSLWYFREMGRAW